MEFKTAIVDKYGTIMYWCSDISTEMALEIIDNHPEWYIKTIWL